MEGDGVAVPLTQDEADHLWCVGYSEGRGGRYETSQRGIQLLLAWPVSTYVEAARHFWSGVRAGTKDRFRNPTEDQYALSPDQT